MQISAENKRFYTALLLAAVLHSALFIINFSSSKPLPIMRETQVLMARMVAPELPPSPPRPRPLQAPALPAQATPHPTVKAVQRTATPTPVQAATAPSAMTTDAPSAAITPMVTAPQSDTASENVGPRALDLSPQAGMSSSRYPRQPSVAEAARAQLGHAPLSASTVFSRHVAAAGIPDCLRDTQDGEGQSKPIVARGLLAVPVIAYAALTGKCK